MWSLWYFLLCNSVFSSLWSCIIFFVFRCVFPFISLFFSEESLGFRFFTLSFLVRNVSKEHFLLNWNIPLNYRDYYIIISKQARFVQLVWNGNIIRFCIHLQVSFNSRDFCSVTLCFHDIIHYFSRLLGPPKYNQLYIWKIWFPKKLMNQLM